MMQRERGALSAEFNALQGGAVDENTRAGSTMYERLELGSM